MAAYIKLPLSELKLSKQITGYGEVQVKAIKKLGTHRLRFSSGV